MRKNVIPEHRDWVDYILAHQDTMTDEEIAEKLHSTAFLLVSVLRRVYGIKRTVRVRRKRV